MAKTCGPKCDVLCDFCRFWRDDYTCTHKDHPKTAYPTDWCDDFECRFQGHDRRAEPLMEEVQGK